MLDDGTHAAASGFCVDHDETLDDLLIGSLQLLQSRAGYRFSLDAVLLAMWVKTSRNLRVMDLGTGSGVIPLLLSAREDTLQVDGLELQETLFLRAVRNVQGNHLSERIRIFQGDMTKVQEQFAPASYGLVLSNPPFFRAGEGIVNPHPERAAARHELHVTLSDVIRAAAHLLQNKGKFCVILRADRLAEYMGLLPQQNLTLARLRMVHPKAGSPASLFLAEAVKGSNRTPVVEPPLIIYEENGAYCREILEWYGK